MTLAAPLARALQSECSWHRNDGQPPTCGPALLALLRADPATLAALAEALHDITAVEDDGGVPDVCNRWPEHEADAERLADALFGAKP